MIRANLSPPHRNVGSLTLKASAIRRVSITGITVSSLLVALLFVEHIVSRLLRYKNASAYRLPSVYRCVTYVTLAITSVNVILLLVLQILQSNYIRPTPTPSPAPPL